MKKVQHKKAQHEKCAQKVQHKNNVSRKKVRHENSAT